MEVLSPPILSFLFLLSLFITIFLKKPSTPGSSITELVKNGHRILDWTTDLLSSSPTATISTAMGIITADPVTVEHTLKIRFDSYIKGDRNFDNLFDLLGHGIFNSDGDSWKLQRRIASLEFSTKTIRTFVLANVRFEVLNRLLPFLSSAAARRTSFDLQEVLERFAFDNVCKVVFNEDTAQLGDNDEDSEGRRFYKAFDVACSVCVERFKTVIPIFWKIKRLFSLGSEGLLKRNIKIVDEYAMRVVKSRRQTVLGDDLLSRFIAEKEENYSDEFLRDIIVSFVLAGRDTTSATLTWFFWLISTKPEVSDKIKNEIKRVRASSSSSKGHTNHIFTLEQVRDMNYLHAALSETLRLYPPVPLQGRVSTEEDMLPCGVKVNKNQVVLYNSFAMGRSERIWGKDAREFKPERWLDGEGVFQPVSPYQYPVFHAGPRMCLGKDMAYIQMKVVAASIMERFDMEVVDVEKVREPELVLIMKLKGGLKVWVREREETQN